jgi:hypothetical protein
MLDLTCSMSESWLEVDLRSEVSAIFYTDQSF